jgi:hypothetical protein
MFRVEKGLLAFPHDTNYYYLILFSFSWKKFLERKKKPFNHINTCSCTRLPWKAFFSFLITHQFQLLNNKILYFAPEISTKELPGKVIKKLNTNCFSFQLHLFLSRVLFWPLQSNIPSTLEMFFFVQSIFFL